MGLEDRISDEMVRDAESILDDQFERANQHLSLTESGEVVPEADDGRWKDRLFLELIGRRYACKAGLVQTPSCVYDEIYELVSKDESTVRKYVNELQDDWLVSKSEDSGEWQAVVRRLPEALDRVEGDG